ncbi:hypothetical protein FRB99_001468 [Tulasnella sp. 403]|nr:hypothetical protein FRB99_001468 [Tulasnella sp. 403]
MASPSTPVMAAINPSSLFYPAPSPAVSKPIAQPSRKRPRTDFQSSEERKEARAERNRIAAQVSRDRRKAEFTELRDRVAYLERENAVLRAAAANPHPTAPSLPLTATATTPAIPGTEDRDKENRELKERVMLLEKALATLSENVVNALQGVGGGLGALSHLISSPASSNASMTTAPTTAPALSGSPSSSAVSSPLVGGVASAASSSSTRHSARVALFDTSPSSPTASITASDLPVCPSTSPDLNNPNPSPEDWLRAIFDPSANTATPTTAPSPATSSPFLLQASSPSSTSSSADTDLSAILNTPPVETRSPLLTMGSTSPTLSMLNGATTAAELSLFGEADAEMEKLLAMLPTPSPTTDSACASGNGLEDIWMSTWLKDEPLQGSVF